MTAGARVDSVGLLATGGGRGKGHVVAGGTVRLSGKVRVDGDVRCGPGREVRKDGTASVSGRIGPLAAPPASLALDLAALEAALATANDNARIPRTSLGRAALSGPAGRTLVVGDGDRLDLPEGTYLLDALRLDGSAVVAVRGRVRILVTGPVRLAGRSRLNPESGPFFLRLWSSGAELSLEGTSSVRAFVLAPRAAAVLGGDTTLTGALRAASVRLEGQARVTRLVEDGSPLAAAFTESGQPLEDGAVFHRSVRPEAKPLPRVPVPEMALLLDGASFRSGDLVTAAGEHRLLARLRDTWGRDAEPSVSFRIVADGGEAPRVVIVSPAAGALLAASPVDVAGTAGTALTVDVNGVAASLSDGTFSARSVPLVEGANVLVATGRDPQGRVGHGPLDGRPRHGPPGDRALRVGTGPDGRTPVRPRRRAGRVGRRGASRHDRGDPRRGAVRLGKGGVKRGTAPALRRLRGPRGKPRDPERAIHRRHDAARGRHHTSRAGKRRRYAPNGTLGNLRRRRPRVVGGARRHSRERDVHVPGLAVRRGAADGRRHGGGCGGKRGASDGRVRRRRRGSRHRGNGTCRGRDPRTGADLREGNGHRLDAPRGHGRGPAGGRRERRRLLRGPLLATRRRRGVRREGDRRGRPVVDGDRSRHGRHGAARRLRPHRRDGSAPRPRRAPVDAAGPRRSRDRRDDAGPDDEGGPGRRRAVRRRAGDGRGGPPRRRGRDGRRGERRDGLHPLHARHEGPLRSATSSRPTARWVARRRSPSRGASAPMR